MPTLRQATLAAVLRRYPLYSGCGSIANHRLVQRLAGAGDEIAWARVAGGYEVAAPLDDFVGRAIFYTGELDRKISWICRRLVRPGDTVLDIGANLGLVTFVLAALVGPSGRVESFEPIPAMQDLVERAIRRNDVAHVHLHKVALGPSAAEMELSVPRGHAGTASLVTSRHSAGSDRISVPVRMLSEVMAARPVDRVRLVKIDVEGFEAEVLRGGAEFFTRTEPDAVLFELNSPGEDRYEAMDLLDDFGYEFLSIPRTLLRMSLAPFDRAAAAQSGAGHDVLAVRKGAHRDEIVGRLR